MTREDDDEKVERLKWEHDERMKARIPTIQQAKTVLFSQIISVNWLLLLSLVGFALTYTHMGTISTFIINFLAIFPYSMMLLLAGDELSMRSGSVLGSLLFVSMRQLPYSPLWYSTYQSKQCPSNWSYQSSY